MKGSVLEQLYEGKKITAGSPIQWGSRITLIVGAGVKDNNFTVPDLIGMTYDEAKYVLDSLGVIAVAVPDPDVTDTLNAFIYKQDPQHLDNQNQPASIKSGMFMDVWLSSTKK
jgi:beta-lactam-binding protein with PASTA domain